MPTNAPSASEAGRPPSRFRRWASRLSTRLLVCNLLLVLLPVAGLFWYGLREFLGSYERQLLDAQERSMAQQGRLLAAALSEHGALGAEGAKGILEGLEQRVTARLRVYDRDGVLLADSSRLGPRRGAEDVEPTGADGPPGESWLYRLGAAPFRLVRRLAGAENEEGSGAGRDEGLAPELRDALAGRYGAAVRQTPGGQRSLTLHVAVPVRSGDRVVGAAVASQSTYRILQDLRRIRLTFFEVFLLSVLLAVGLSLALATTISRPVRRLRAEAASLVDRRGRLRGTFSGSAKLDEVGELARTLERLSHQVDEHVRFVEAFAADVSHEFKNPLTSIRAATEMLSQVEEPETRRRLLATVEGEIARMEGLLSAVREMSLIDSLLESEATAPIDLGRLLRGLVEGARARAPEGVAVEIEPPAETVTVRAAPERLVQIFDNLIDNALGFAPVGSAVRVEIAALADARPSGEAVVTVTDRGPGIPPEHLARIFDRFFTWRPDETSGRRHTGLGLAIVKAIAEGYGGSVRAANAEGGGARLEVRLPLAAPRPERSASTDRSDPADEAVEG